jgi:signal transduction histidine kinase
MEVELLRFQRSLVEFENTPSEQARDDLLKRFDILWSRLDLMSGSGRVGTILRRYDEGHGTLDQLFAYLQVIDPVLLAMEPGDASAIPRILEPLDEFQEKLRLYTLRVVRGDVSAATEVRERMVLSSRTTALIGASALVISLLSLFLIMRDNARQREMAAINRRQAEAAEAASRAKSRFLTMMSHELRNPLNGILGPLALLGQTGTDEKHQRLIGKAQQSGRTMLRMLRGLLDYGDIQDDRLVLKREAFRAGALADDVRRGLSDVASEGGARVAVQVDPSVPDLVWGDPDRFAQIFVYLGEYLLQPSHSGAVSVRFAHDGKSLIGDVAFSGDGAADLEWKLDLLIGLSAESTQAFSTDALGPLIARGLLAAAHGVLTLPHDGDNGRIIRVVIPAESVVFEKIRVHLETRSATLETLYRAALRSERVAFLDRAGADAADIVLVDATSVGERSLIAELRARHPDALFVSLGLPASPGQFDDIVETPHDMAGLRKSVLGRLAS